MTPEITVLEVVSPIPTLCGVVQRWEHRRMGSGSAKERQQMLERPQTC